MAIRYHQVTGVTALFLALFLSCAVGRGSVSCDLAIKSIKKFKIDSAQSYINQMVKYDAVEPITKSTYTVELRIYNSSASTEIIDLHILRLSDDSAAVVNKKIFIRSAKSPKDNYKVTYRDDRIMVCLAEWVRKYPSNQFCSLLADLNKNRLFDYDFVHTRYIDKFDSGELDSGSWGWIEVKVKNKFRNFKYNLGGNRKVSTVEGATYLNNVTGLLYQNLKLR